MAFFTCGRRPLGEGDPEEVNVDMVLQNDIIREKQKEMFEAIENVDIEKAKCLIAKKEFKLQDAKETAEGEFQREAFHFLAGSLSKPDGDLKEMFSILHSAGCNVNCADKFGNTPLMLAAEKENMTILKLLLEKRADAKKTNSEGNSPLHWAAKNGKANAVNLLLEYQANINIQNKEFYTPLHLAVINERRNVVQLLIAKGADVNLKDVRNEKTPVQYAKSPSMENLFESPTKSELSLARVEPRLQSNSAQKGKKQVSSNGRGEDVIADSGDQCLDLFAYCKVIGLQSIDAKTAAIKASDKLQLDKLSMADPPDYIMMNCRELCDYLKSVGRQDIVKELRKTLPSGMTGPILDNNGLFSSIDPVMSKELTRSLCVDERWKDVANEFGIPSYLFAYFDRKDNPAEAILQEVCSKRILEVGELYDVLVKCKAATLADRYL